MLNNIPNVIRRYEIDYLLEKLDRLFKEDPNSFTTGKRIISTLFPSERGLRPYDSLPHLSVNVIPGGRPGTCRDLLLVAIGNNDNIEIRILQAIRHVFVSCRKITKYIIFVATKWRTHEWNKYCNDFKKEGIHVFLKMIGTPGIQKLI